MREATAIFIFALCFFSVLGKAEAIHDKEPVYTLLVENPFRLMNKELEREFGATDRVGRLAPPEIYNYLDESELRGREHDRPMPEVLRSIGSGFSEFAANAFDILSEEDILFFRSLHNLYLNYAHPRLEGRFDRSTVGFFSGKPKTDLQGFRIGASLRFDDNPSSMIEVVSPVPYAKLAWGWFETEAYINPLSRVAKLSIGIPDKNPSGISIAGIYEYGLKKKHQSGELALLKRVIIDSDFWLKLRIRYTEPGHGVDVWSSDGVSIGLFFFGSF